jgi:ubiquinone/menaquinone biosynthesis C-methylase UbiE
VSEPTTGPAAGVDYWRDRARALGARAVVNVDHPEDAELDALSADHRGLILPLLAAQLEGSEEVVLDLGCGVGRFTDDLAGLVGGRAVGVDPTPELLALAEATPRTTYRHLVADVLPLVDDEVDVVFTSMVLGGIPAEPLAATLAEVRRVLRPGGLVFLVESVGEPSDGGTWSSRTVAGYRELLPWAPLHEVGAFDDAGDAVVVLAGRAAA